MEPSINLSLVLMWRERCHSRVKYMVMSHTVKIFYSITVRIGQGLAYSLFLLSVVLGVICLFGVLFNSTFVRHTWGTPVAAHICSRHRVCRFDKGWPSVKLIAEKCQNKWGEDRVHAQYVHVCQYRLSIGGAQE